MTPPWLEAMRQHNYTDGHSRDEVAALLALVEALGEGLARMVEQTGGALRASFPEPKSAGPEA